ncbi:MAG: M15 family metallopeptidase [Caulobacteraceae bacterium]
MINSRDIKDLHPRLQMICRNHIEECTKRGIMIIITSTLRDQDYQTYLYNQGRSRPGNIVTNSKLLGPHGFGLAYDVAPVTSDGKTILWEDTAKWEIIGAEGKKLGLTWGGDWKSIVDKPHFELTDGLTAAALRSGKRPKWWVTALTLEEAVEILSEKGIINTPEYWLKNAVIGSSVEGEFAAKLIINMANKLIG